MELHPDPAPATHVEGTTEEMVVHGSTSEPVVDPPVDNPSAHASSDQTTSAFV